MGNFIKLVAYVLVMSVLLLSNVDYLLLIVIILFWILSEIVLSDKK